MADDKKFDHAAAYTACMYALKKTYTRVTNGVETASQDIDPLIRAADFHQKQQGK